MSRGLVCATFALFTLAALVQAVEHTGDAIAQMSGRAWLQAGFWILKTGVVAAFCWAVLRRAPAKRPAREPVAFAACIAAMLGAVALRGPDSEASTSLLIAGEAVALLSCAFLLASVLALGTCFGVLPEARGLVTRGPYRFVRHPVYLGELGACAGLVMGAPTAWNLSAAAVLLAGQLVRMRLEERALALEFPEYGLYAARTPRILPLRPLHGALAGLGTGRTTLFGALALGIVVLVGSQMALASSGRLPAPRQLAPASSARIGAVPSFSWAAVRHAAKYEFQLAADASFESIVGGQGHGSFQTPNTYASVDKTLADGTYYWRVRAIRKSGGAGRWSPARPFVKRWTTTPTLLGPTEGSTVSYPGTPLVLRWTPVPYAYKYLVTIATDPSLAHSALGDRTPSVETSGTVFALSNTLAPGTYYWAITPLDAGKHPGARSPVGSFTWSWPTGTTARVADLRSDPRIPDATVPRLYDPQFSWDAVPGAAQYQVEVSQSQDFAPGSRVCCDDAVLGTSLSPRHVLPNNTYYWRVRALDLDGNAGAWNSGPTFRKDFDAVLPAIPNLHVRDATGDAVPASGAPLGLPTSDSPVIAWDPVPGASSYEVNVVPWDSGLGACNWGISGFAQHWTVSTAATAWTPLAGAWNLVNPAGSNAPPVSYDALHALVDGTSYCAQVRARTDRDASLHDVRGDWTQVGGAGQAAFTFTKSPLATCTAAPAMPAAGYHAPADGRRAQGGTANRRTPLFTWERVSGACGYYVVVARDPELTNVVDVALTTEPAYAPRLMSRPSNYTDETTSYYWAVVPTMGSNGAGWTFLPTENHPQAFEKRSVPPALLEPAVGGDVYAQPKFHWSMPLDDEGRPEGVHNYRLQVDEDPTFGSPIDDVVTDATGYTSTSTYPADTVLYWRVRADVEAANDPKSLIGLTWSPVGTFRRRLPAPTLSPGNPVEGQGIPTLSWSPVDGAVSYDMHVEQADGTKRDFTMRSTAFTPTVFYGTGIWRWQVRANFKGVTRTVSSGYSGLAPFARRIDTPHGLRTTVRPGSALLAWDPPAMARQYRIQISTVDSFSTLIEEATTENTNYAPRMLNAAWATGRQLYWRVAAVDEGFNVGGWATSPLRKSRPMRVRARGAVRVGRNSSVRVTVTDSAGRKIKGALVRISGAGMGKTKSTSRRGMVVLRVRGLKKGNVTVRAEKRGYTPTAARLRVR